MKKTSRRNFAKSITAAIAATPFLVSKAVASGQEKATGASPFDNRTHDTPPPLEVLDGSLRIEAHDKHDESQDAATKRWNYDNVLYPNIAHVKIIHGSGDMIYRNLDADGIKVSVTLTGSAGDLTLEGGVTNNAGNKVFRINCDKKMKPSNPGKTEKRPFKFDHPGNGGDFWVNSIVISQGGNTLFQVTAKNPSDEEYRIMIWNQADRAKPGRK
jgi:hypothetical protein